MEALPYRLARRQALMFTVTHHDRRFILNTYPGRESGEQLEIFLELGGVNPVWVVFSPRFRAEHLRPLAVEVDQLVGDISPLRGVGREQLLRGPSG